eukprot:232063-Chlamydomonas_euryale.AAC.1
MGGSKAHPGLKAHWGVRRHIRGWEGKDVGAADAVAHCWAGVARSTQEGVGMADARCPAVLRFQMPRGVMPGFQPWATGQSGRTGTEHPNQAPPCWLP